MESHTKCAKAKAILWKANKDRIKHLVSLRLDTNQVEEEMQRSGCRITTQVREYIQWEKGAPKVRELLAQGFDVEAIEEKMRLIGWKWTDNIKKKAWWEYYREEIIGHYISHRSVEAVREIMAKKGFMPKTRIYYEWLNSWGISTSIHRRSLPGIDISSEHESNNPTRRGSANTPHNHLHGSLLESSNSDMWPTGVVDSPGPYHPSRGSPLGHRSSGYSISPMPAQDESVSDDDDNSYDGDDFFGWNITGTGDETSPLIPRNAAIVLPESTCGITGASESKHGFAEGFRRMVNQQNSSLMPNQNPLNQPRGSFDSAVAFDLPYIPHPINSIHQEPSGGQGAAQKSLLHLISCPMNHQALGLNCHYCGSSRLQELALSAQSISPYQVRDNLCRYMRLEDVRRCDYAGNTFFHKLAASGAPWEYFKACIHADMDPCHRNAYGQTFAHVLDISVFGSDLTECLVSLLNHGIDFGLRDVSGRTVLHCLYGQPVTLEMARQILGLLDNPGRLLSLRDVSGQTPYDLLKHNLRYLTSANDGWSNMELQQQMAASFEHIVNGGILRLRDDWPIITDDLEGLRAALQTQYKAVINHASNDIVVEAVDGSNAFHSQAALTAIHAGPTDLCSLEKFIALGVDANYYDKYGRTPLEAIITLPRDWEIELTTSEKVSLLIDKGKASVDSRNRMGHTPLYSAAIRGLDRTVEVLLQRGSHVNIRDINGKSLLKAVIETYQQAFGEFLASPYCRYPEAQVSRIEECKVLLERYGAVVDPTPAQAMCTQATSSSMNE